MRVGGQPFEIGAVLRQIASFVPDGRNTGIIHPAMKQSKVRLDIDRPQRKARVEPGDMAGVEDAGGFCGPRGMAPSLRQDVAHGKRRARLGQPEMRLLPQTFRKNLQPLTRRRGHTLGHQQGGEGIGGGQAGQPERRGIGTGGGRSFQGAQEKGEAHGAIGRAHLLHRHTRALRLQDEAPAGAGRDEPPAGTASMPISPAICMSSRAIASLLIDCAGFQWS